jgi:hypothetical protein
MNAEPAKITHTRFDTTFELNGKEILIDYTRTAKNVTEAGYAIIQDRYLNEGESDPQESLARVACTYADDSEHAQRLYDYFSMNWAYPATPVHANGGTAKGLPISCFLNQPEDSREGLGEHYHENLWLSTSGGGIGSDWSKIRSKDTATSKGNKTTGVIPFIKVIDSLTVASWQGSCYIEGTEILTSKGWKDFRDLTETDLVAQVDEHRKTTFVNPLEVTVNDYNDDLVVFESHNSLLKVTKNHRMVFEKEIKNQDGTRSKTGELVFKTAEDMLFHRDNFYHISTEAEGDESNLTLTDKLNIALQADGHINSNNLIEFHFSKQRKIDYLALLLNKAVSLDRGKEVECRVIPETENTKFYLKGFNSSLN